MDNTYISLLEKLQTKRLVVFGCGRYFGEFVLRYPSLIEKIDFVLDNDQAKERYRYKDSYIPIFRPTEIIRKDLTKYVLLFCSDQWKKMKEQLDKMLSCDYIFYHYPLVLDYTKNKELGIYHRIIVPAIEKLREFSKTQDVVKLLGVQNENELLRGLEQGDFYTIPRLTVVLTPKCSLKCEECSNLMWRFTDKHHLSSEKIVTSLGNVIGQLDFVPCVELIGGEPFVAQNLKEVLGFLLQQKKVLSIEITTNATIMPSSEVIGQMKNPKVYIHISNYGKVVNQDRFIDCMKENEIQFCLPESYKKWTATGGIVKRGREAGELVRQYYKCTSGYLCKTLWEDRIYPCARAASLAVLGIMPKCPSVDAGNQTGLRERLYSFYVAASCEACDYCDVAIENPVYVDPAVQLEK